MNLHFKEAFSLYIVYYLPGTLLGAFLDFYIGDELGGLILLLSLPFGESLGQSLGLDYSAPFISIHGGFTLVSSLILELVSQTPLLLSGRPRLRSTPPEGKSSLSSLYSTYLGWLLLAGLNMVPRSVAKNALFT